MKHIRSYADYRHFMANEAKFSENPVALAILGAPASGKSYMVKLLQRLAKSNSLAKLDNILVKGVDLTVDKLRMEFQSKDLREQLKGFLSAFVWLREQNRLEPEVYGKWFGDIKKTWAKIDSVSDAIGTSVSGDGKLVVNGVESAEEIYRVLDRLPEEEVSKMVKFLDSYADYKRVVRWLQSQKQQEARSMQKDLIFDEAGDEPQKIVSKFRQLRKYGYRRSPSSLGSIDSPYITSIFLIHGESPVTNLIQNAGRMVVGTDGGRDSSGSIVQAWNDIQKGMGIYESSSEKSVEISSDESEIVRLFDQLKNANTEDNVSSGNSGKAIDMFVKITPQQPRDAYERTIKGMAPMAAELFNAILLYHSMTLELDQNAKSIVRELVPEDMSEGDIAIIFKKAIDSGEYSHPLNNLDKMHRSLSVSESAGERFGNLYCDMDGVVADFHSFVSRYEPDFDDDWSNIPPRAFSMMEKTSSADDIVEFVSSRFPEFMFLSAAPKAHRGEISTNSVADKKGWIEKNFGISGDRVIVVDDKLKKDAYAIGEDGRPNILVDDTIDTIERWNRAGGKGIFYESFPQMVRDLYRTLASEGGAL